MVFLTMTSKKENPILEQQSNKIMGFLSRSSFDPQAIIVSIINEQIDKCVSVGFEIISTIINKVIFILKIESNFNSGGGGSICLEKTVKSLEMSYHLMCTWLKEKNNKINMQQLPH